MPWTPPHWCVLTVAPNGGGARGIGETVAGRSRQTSCGARGVGRGGQAVRGSNTVLLAYFNDHHIPEVWRPYATWRRAYDQHHAAYSRQGQRL